MAEDKGFWRRLFGKGKPPGDGPPKEPDAPQDPAQASRPDQAPEQKPEQKPEETPEVIPEDSTEPTPPSVVADDAENPAKPEPDQARAQAGETQVLETAELKTDAVGRIYAKALLELAQEQGQIDALAQEIQDLLPIVADGGELDLIMNNPAIGEGELKKIVQRVFEGKVSDLLYRFLQVVADKNRLASLPQIAGGYLLLVAEHRGQVEVEAFVASPMDPATVEQVAQTIGQHLGKQVTLRQRVDESLIGGLKIKIGDRLIDASVASQLRNMKNKMIAAARG